MRRYVRFRDRSGRQTTLQSRRFVSMADRTTPGSKDSDAEDWSGPVEVITAIEVGLGTLASRAIDGWKGGT